MEDESPLPGNGVESEFAEEEIEVPDPTKLLEDKIANLAAELTKIPTRIYECEERLSSRLDRELGSMNSSIREAHEYVNTVHAEMESHAKKRKKEKLEQVSEERGKRRVAWRD